MATYLEMLKDNNWLEDVKQNYVWHKAHIQNRDEEPEPIEELWNLLKEKFNSGYGGVEGANFVIITKNWVYFPCCYDGAEWVERVPRNPNDDFIPEHFGGG